MNFLNTLSWSTTQGLLEFISTALTIISLGTALGFGWWAIITSKKIAQNSIKANLILHFTPSENGNVIFKLTNFGSNMGLLIDIKITPKLSFQKLVFENLSPESIKHNNESFKDIKTIDEFKNIYLYPTQSISSAFPLNYFPYKDFEVTIHYKSLDNYSKDKIFENSYKLTNSIFTDTYNLS